MLETYDDIANISEVLSIERVTGNIYNSPTSKYYSSSLSG